MAIEKIVTTNKAGQMVTILKKDGATLAITDYDGDRRLDSHDGCLFTAPKLAPGETKPKEVRFTRDELQKNVFDNYFESLPTTTAKDGKIIEFEAAELYEADDGVSGVRFANTKEFSLGSVASALTQAEETESDDRTAPVQGVNPNWMMTPDMGYGMGNPMQNVDSREFNRILNQFNVESYATATTAMLGNSPFAANAYPQRAGQYWTAMFNSLLGAMFGAGGNVDNSGRHDDAVETDEEKQARLKQEEADAIEKAKLEKMDPLSPMVPKIELVPMKHLTPPTPPTPPTPKKDPVDAGNVAGEPPVIFRGIKGEKQVIINGKKTLVDDYVYVKGSGLGKGDAAKMYSTLAPIHDELIGRTYTKGLSREIITGDRLYMGKQAPYVPLSITKQIAEKEQKMEKLKAEWKKAPISERGKINAELKALDKDIKRLKRSEQSVSNASHHVSAAENFFLNLVD